MKKIIYVFFIGFLCQTLAAQTAYNEWIDYDQTYYKFKVAGDKLHKIEYQTLADTGIPLVGSHFKMIHNGEEIPLYVSTDGELGSSDYIEFYGKQNDGEFDKLLFQNPEWHLHEYRSLFTDTAAYFLTSDASSTNLRYANTPNDVSDAPEKEAYFWHTSIRPQLNVFFAGEPFRNLGGVNNHFADFENGEGFISSAINGGDSKAYTLPVSSVYHGVGDAQVSMKIVGNSDDVNFIPDHHTSVAIAGTAYKDTIYEGYINFRTHFEVPTEELSSPNTTIDVTSLGNVSATDRIGVSYVSITYPRTFDFNNQRSFLFELPNDDTKYIEITNFNGGSAPVLYDLTNNLRLIPVIDNSSGDNVYQFLLEQVSLPGGSDTRQLFFTNSTSSLAIRTITEVESMQFVDYSLSANQGDYIILSHPKLMQGAVNEVARYQDYRNSSAGGDYTATVVNIEQLYDQFAWGIQKNPLAINHFVNYALANWDIEPEYLLLLGKAIGYHKFRLFPPDLEDCLIPTFGHRGSDNQLTVKDIHSYHPQLAVGRIPASTPHHVKIYLDKLIDYEDDVNLPCTREARLWTKDAIHLAGGNDVNEADQFLGYLEKYKNYYEGVAFSGDVVATFTKAETDVVEFVEIDELINNGLKIINFVGHSGAGSIWAVDIDTAGAYENHGKYPFIFSSSCFVGNIHAPLSDPTLAMSVDYILAEELGAIGFLATLSFGFPTYMDIFVDEFYQGFTQDNYGMSVGKLIQQGIPVIDSLNIHPVSGKHNDGVKITSQEFTLAGDPAVVLGFWEHPEFIIEDNMNRSDISIEPMQITANLDSFKVNLVVSNLGRSVTDSFNIEVNRLFPDGETTQITTKRFPTPVYIDSFSLYIPTGESSAAAGENQLTITIDSDNEHTEDCKDNNVISRELFIFSDLLVPLFPCNFSIVSDPDVTLFAATGQALAPNSPYLMQIDTTELFNSPLFQQMAVNSEGGVIQWQPAMDMVNDRVYYWRASLAETDGSEFNWQNSSFVYLPDSEPGWNQSHYYQYQKDQLEGLAIHESSRQFEYPTVNSQVFAHNALLFPAIYFGINSIQLGDGSCLSAGGCRGGVVFVVIEPGENLEPWVSEPQMNSTSQCEKRGSYGNVHCANNPVNGIEFYTGSVEQLDAMTAFIHDSIPDGHYVLAYSVFNHRLEDPEPGEPMVDYIDNIRQFFIEDLNAPQITDVVAERPFILFGRKNVPSFETQMVFTDDPLEELTLEVLVPTGPNSGTMTSTVIGPSLEWNNLAFDYHNSDIDGLITADQFRIFISGIAANGNETLLLQSGTSNTLDISSISANEYPFLKLEAFTSDTAKSTPPQLDFWRVHHKLASDLAINAQQHLVFESDTVQEGEDIHFEMAVTNAGEFMTDSILVQYSIIDHNNGTQIVPYPRHQPAGPTETIITEFTYNTEGLQGNNVLVVELNANSDQPEKFRFNNLLSIPFFVKTDLINPLIDVTFDGRHILNGELVSAKPEILVRIKDENQYLALNDTSDFSLLVRAPDGSEQVVPLGSNLINFTPANLMDNKNEALISYHPEFVQDGIYELEVKASDRSDNDFDRNAYKISFEVVNQALVSNLLNYPNPFTSSTQFVFTLTGSEIPEFFNIQIMTISGRVVREITREELGNIHIGQNVTEYTWDGTDEFGNELGNGLYLYRVITRLQGEKLDQYETTETVDGLFKNGIGKMYLMR